MKTKIVYALVSNVSDCYLEQAYISVVSLRMHNPEAYVVFAVDDRTDATLHEERAKILELISEKIVVFPPKEYSNVMRSRYLKTTLREHISGDYLFIDTDTIIAASLEGIDELKKMSYDVAAVLDHHLPFSFQLKSSKRISIRAKKAGWEITANDMDYFNSGVMFVTDTEISHELYRRWNNNWLYSSKQGFYVDQIPLGKTNQELGYIIKELPGEWNCQIATNGLRYIACAKIIHYFGSDMNGRQSPYLFTDINIYGRIKENKFYIPQDLKLLLDNPRSAFYQHTELLAGDDCAIKHSSFMRLLRKKPSLYSILNKIIWMLQ